MSSVQQWEKMVKTVDIPAMRRKPCLSSFGWVARNVLVKNPDATELQKLSARLFFRRVQ